MRVLLFAHLKDAAGCAELEFPLAAPVNADGLWQRIETARPELGRFRRSVRLAKNCEYAARDATFTDADEVALIPPVSGG
jgi:molybdopterin converting factor subunit 1